MSASYGTEPAILLVDDNPHDVVLLRLAFRRVGIIDPIKLVKDGVDAVRYLKGEGIYGDRHSYPAPTLMLLDLNMPQTSGFEVLRWVRQQPGLRNLKVVVMTGSKESDDVQRAYQLGADSYLVKPTKFADLVKMTQALKSYCGTPTTNAESGIAPTNRLLTSDELASERQGSATGIPVPTSSCPSTPTSPV